MAARILYIEDESFFANTISGKLEAHGFSVDTAKDGKAGLEALQKNQYDLVLLDLILPELDGFQVLEAVQRDPKLQRVPVVVLSNLSAEGDKEKARELGAQQFYVKINSTPNEVLALVRALTESQTAEKK